MAKKDRTEPVGASAADPVDTPASAPAAIDDRSAGPGEETAASDLPRDADAPPPPLQEPKEEPTPRSAASLLAAGLLGGVTGAVLLAAAVVWLAPLAEINERVTAVENAIGNTASRRGLETAERRIAALETRAEAARQEAERPVATSGEIDLAPLMDRIGRLDQAIGAGRERLERVERLAAERPPALGPEAARLSVALLLREKLRGGMTVAPELASLEALGVDGARLARLRDFTRGAPVAAARLAADFERIAPEILRSGGTPAGIGDRLTAALSQAVKIRRIDEPAAKDAGDPLDAIRTALRNDEPIEAERLWRALPAPAQEASRDFGKALAARAAAVGGADALVAFLVDDVALVARSAGGRL